MNTPGATALSSEPSRRSMKPKQRIVGLFLAALLTAPFSSCGTLMFHERQDAPHSGKLDPNVLILDGFGLLLFVIPGLVAFGLDFHTGAIYLPPGVEEGEGPFIRGPRTPTES